ncbi:MAG TPA: glycosyltransferase family 4 protein [Caldilineae bacterium]|nr:glycosyltransferase family 4 protein [Caldilineae bacterium]
MRILAIAPTAFYADYGCHIRIRGQLRALQGAGHEIRLVTYPAGRATSDLAVTRIPLPFARTMPVGSSRRKILLDLLLAPTALATALRFRPHIIHTYLHEGALIGWFIARLLRVPLTADYQGSLTAEMLDHGFLSPHSRFLRPLRRLECWIDRRPDILFPSSDAALAQLEQRTAPRQRLHPLPDAVDPALFSPQPSDPALRAALGLDSDRPTIVYLGLLAPYQGIDLLLEAAATPPLRDHPAQFLVMGFPHVARYQNKARKLGLGERVRFTGAIPYSHAPRHLALGDVAVAPKLSATEGSGKLLPYMSMALPIVATDTPAHRQYLGGDSILVGPATAEALATALVEALSELSIWRQGALRLRQKVKERYTWEQTAQTMEALFRQLLGQ